MLPEVACWPDHAPEAVQLNAFVLDHVNVAEPLNATESVLAFNVTVGTGVVPLTVTVAD